MHSLTDDTLVIYTSDHSMALGEHGFWAHGEVSWPSITHCEANRILMIITSPYAPRWGQVCDHLVGITNITATVLDYIGARLLG